MYNVLYFPIWLVYCTVGCTQVPVQPLDPPSLDPQYTTVHKSPSRKLTFLNEDDILTNQNLKDKNLKKVLFLNHNTRLVHNSFYPLSICVNNLRQVEFNIFSFIHDTSCIS